MHSCRHPPKLKTSGSPTANKSEYLLWLLNILAEGTPDRQGPAKHHAAR
jgi:hypothetical protein